MKYMSILFLQKHTLSSLDQTKEIAHKLGAILKENDVVTFKGNLGAGKTTFIKYIIQHIMNEDITVTSPTFNLVQIYESSKFPIWHFDMYRLKTSEEVFEIGYEEALTQALSLIEWPERIQEFLPKDRLDVIITLNNSNIRTIEFIPHGTWENR